MSRVTSFSLWIATPVALWFTGYAAANLGRMLLALGF